MNNVVVRHHRDVTVEIIILIVWAVAVMFLLARSHHKRKEECCNQCLEILHFSFVLFSGYKDSANRVQNKISLLIFYAEVQPSLSKDSANREQNKINLHEKEKQIVLESLSVVKPKSVIKISIPFYLYLCLFATTSSKT